MKFIYPYFLFALFFILIPIIVHLFSFRRHKIIYFSNVRFLKNVKQQTKAINKLKHLLVLISRILFLSFLTFAFAQPYIPSENDNTIVGEKAISIYIDNSFSMETLNENGSILADAKIKAIEIVNAYGNSDKFQLLTNSFEAKHQRLVNKEEFIQLLEEITISPAVKNISEVISRQNDLLNNSNIDIKKAFLISDFQKQTSDITKIHSDSNINYLFLPLQSNGAANLYIDSVWFESPVRSPYQSEKLYVKVVNNSNKTFEDVPLKLTLNNQTISPASFTIQANDKTTIPLIYNNKKTGFIQGLVSINDYPIVFDDNYYFTYNVLKNIPVMAIYGKEENKFINALFAKDSSIVFTSLNEKSIDYSLLSKQRFILLYDIEKISSGLSTELKRFLEDEGGYLLIFPSDKADMESYNSFFLSLQSAYYSDKDTTKRKVNYINYKHRTFFNVFDKVPDKIDLPTVNNYFIIKKAARSANEEVMKLNNGNDFILEQKCNKGSLFLCAVPLSSENSNFSTHAIFVPVIFNMALNSINSQPLFYTIGNNELIEINQPSFSEKPITLSGNNKQIIPGIVKRGFSTILQTYNYITNEGYYTVINNTDTVSVIAFNYNRKESDLETYSVQELMEVIDKNSFKNIQLIKPQIADVGKFLIEKGKGISLWKLCIILALIFVTTEIILLKFWK